MSESHRIMQGPGIVDVIATETGGGCVGESVMDHWSLLLASKSRSL